MGLCPYCTNGCTQCQPAVDPAKPGNDKTAISLLAGAKHVHTFTGGEEPREMLIHNNVLFVATNKMVYQLNEQGKLEPLSVVANV